MSAAPRDGSIGSDRNARTPGPMNSTVIRTTNSGWSSANATTFWIMPAAPGLRVRERLEELFEQQAPRGHHALTRLQTSLDRHDAVPLAADADFGAAVASGRFLYEHHVRVALQDHGCHRNDRPLRLRPGGVHGHQHLRLEQPPWVCDGAAHLHSARARVYFTGHQHHSAAKHAIRPCRSAHRQPRARLHSAHIALGKVELDPQLRRVADDEQRREQRRRVGEHLIGANFLTGTQVALDYDAAQRRLQREHLIGGGRVDAVQRQACLGPLLLCARATSAWAASTSFCATTPCRSRSASRASVRSASARSVAARRASACAWPKSGDAIVVRTSPGRTGCPASTATLTTRPANGEKIRTVTSSFHTMRPLSLTGWGTAGAAAVADSDASWGLPSGRITRGPSTRAFAVESPTSRAAALLFRQPARATASSGPRAVAWTRVME